ncbi:MAG: PC4/YdbC family ssDNA-binding protein [bacterium]
MADDFKFDVVKELGTFGVESKGWIKKFKIISWNDRDPKLDIRTWGPGEKMGKGISLNKQELVELKKFLDEQIESLDIK